MSEIFEKLGRNELFSRAVAKLSAGRVVHLSGLWGSAGALTSSLLGMLTGRLVVVIVPEIDQADDFADDVEALTAAAVHLFPAWEEGLAEAGNLNSQAEAERLKLLNMLAGAGGGATRPAGIIVAPVLALLQPVPDARALAHSRLCVGRGESLDPMRLSDWLISGGYEHVDQVDQQGQFARRGGIVDVFSPATDQPVRLEFFGDSVESIRTFDLDSQRSTLQLESYTIISGLPAGSVGESFARYLPADAVVCIYEPAETFKQADELFSRLACDLPAGDPDRPDGAMNLIRPDEFLKSLEGFARVSMDVFRPAQAQAGAEEEIIDMSFRSLERLSVNTGEAMGELDSLSRAGEVWVYCENQAEQQRFLELIEGSYPGLAGRIQTAVGHIVEGFEFTPEKLVVVAHHELFHRYAKRRCARAVRAGRPIESLLELHPGDYVVHVGHGIARFDGLRTIEKEGRKEEYLSLRFAGNAMLHVPASRIDLVQRYVGTRKIRPALSKLGGTGWARQKQKVSLAVRDLASEQLRIQALRRAMPGLSYPADTEWQVRFAQEFPYTETPDQIQVMAQIDADMYQPRPMDRLLCGDVGYGKTELAMRAAFKTAEAGRQVAVLVPTTVLADQHYRTFCERFADYPFQIDVLSRFRTPAQQQDLLARLAEGRLDIVIGTHRLISSDVVFSRLGLVITDEEQRFGVAHKEHLKGLRASVDVLTMTATPIPRTLHMALLGLRDISSLATAPLDRRAIHTEVVHYDENLIRKAILTELSRQGQVFFVHNRVMDIEAVAQDIRRLAGDARVTIAHGRMDEKRLEQTMHEFVNRRIDVLVCTTIIESGLDIPTANTIIIDEADRLGLAELHQLRGRVGRYKHRAFCYLLLPRRRQVSSLAARRLKSVEEFSDLGAGFQIAMRDLEIRGAGNILGKEQSGHIALVGYELYCRLLEQAVSELQGKPASPRPHVHVELGLDAVIPSDYVSSDRQRMEIYRRLAGCCDVADLGALRADLQDAFGKAPPQVLVLLDVAEVRIRAASWGIDSIVKMEPDLVFTVRDFKLTSGLFDNVVGTVRLPDDHTVHWRLPQLQRKQPRMLFTVLKALRRSRRSV